MTKNAASFSPTPSAEVDVTLAWAREFFERRDSRDLVEVTIESEADPVEIDALRRLFDAAVAALGVDGGVADLAHVLDEEHVADVGPG